MLPATFSSETRRPGAGAAAGFRVVVTLAIFVVAFLTFLIAPLVTLGVAALAYTALRTRSHAGGREPDDPGAVPTHEFGTGAR